MARVAEPPDRFRWSTSAAPDLWWLLYRKSSRPTGSDWAAAVPYRQPEPPGRPGAARHRVRADSVPTRRVGESRTMAPTRTCCRVPKFKESLVAIGPMLHEVAGRLKTLPDAVLVDVKNDEGTVRIEKSGAELLIRVLSDAERVEIAIPVDSVRRLMEKLEA